MGGFNFHGLFFTTSDLDLLDKGMKFFFYHSATPPIVLC